MSAAILFKPRGTLVHPARKHWRGSSLLFSLFLKGSRAHYRGTLHVEGRALRVVSLSSQMDPDTAGRLRCRRPSSGPVASRSLEAQAFWSHVPTFPGVRWPSTAICFCYSLIVKSFANRPARSGQPRSRCHARDTGIVLHLERTFLRLCFSRIAGPPAYTWPKYASGCAFLTTSPSCAIFATASHRWTSHLVLQDAACLERRLPEYSPWIAVAVECPVQATLRLAPREWTSGSSKV